MERLNPLRIEDTEDFCREVADAYDRLPMWEDNEIWRWELLRDSVERMYDQMVQKVDVEFVEGQPYDTAEQMRDEVKRTGVLKISTDFNEHPFFTPLENLKFRAVHDYVVHIIPGDRGPDFSRRGELRAYNLHRRLAPPDAWPALFTEVAAQACYANARGEFPVQKVAVFGWLRLLQRWLAQGAAKGCELHNPQTEASSVRGLKFLPALGYGPCRRKKPMRSGGKAPTRFENVLSSDACRRAKRRRRDLPLGLALVSTESTRGTVACRGGSTAASKTDEQDTTAANDGSGYSALRAA